MSSTVAQRLQAQSHLQQELQICYPLAKELADVATPAELDVIGDAADRDTLVYVLGTISDRLLTTVGKVNACQVLTKS